MFPLAMSSNIFGVACGFGVGTAAFDLLLLKLLSIENSALIWLLFQTLSAMSRLVGLPFYLHLPFGGRVTANLEKHNNVDAIQVG